MPTERKRTADKRKYTIVAPWGHKGECFALACGWVVFLGIVGLVASQYDSESRGFTEFGATDLINPLDSLSYNNSHRSPTFDGGTIPEFARVTNDKISC